GRPAAELGARDCSDCGGVPVAWHGRGVGSLRRPRKSRDQRWSTFLKDHAQAIVACDFFTAVTATFRVIYVFVALEIGSRRLIHFNATEHPTAEWTLQQLREALPGDEEYKFLLHDRHKTFSAGLDEEIERWGIAVLKWPAHAPMAML